MLTLYKIESERIYLVLNAIKASFSLLTNVSLQQQKIKQNSFVELLTIRISLLLFLLFSFSHINFAQVNSQDTLKRQVKLTSTKWGKKKKLFTPPTDTLSLQFKKDSNFKNQLKNEAHTADSMYRSAIKESFAPRFGLGGTVMIEAFATNAQNPFQLNEKQYVRADVNTTLTLMGLPFNTGFYYTTEDQSLYNSNKVYFSFDAYAFKQRLLDNWQAQNQALLRKHKLREYQIGKLDASEDALKAEMEKIKAQIPDTSALHNELEKQKQIAEQKARKELESQENKYRSKADSIAQAKQSAVQDSLNQVEGRFNDSLQSRQENTHNKVDTSLINKYKRMEKRLAQIQEKRAKLEALQQNDTLQRVIGFLQNPKQQQDEMLNSAQGKMKMAMATDRFDIGAINPVYSEFTSQGILLRGMDWQISNERVFAGFSAGRSTVNLPGLFTRSKPKFGRNFGILTGGIGDKEKNFLALHLMGAKDSKPDSLDLSNPPVRNSVASLEGNYQIKEQFFLESEIARSSYRLNNGQGEPIVTLNDAPVSASALNQRNIAYKAKLTYRGEKNTEASAAFRRINPGFKTIGNIFLRTNMQEVEFKLKQAFYKRRIRLSTFYKENKDNVLNLLETTNRMKGYGGTLNVAIPKYPILTVGYMPYEQGNNHPDSLLQTNNHFSMLFANLTYTKRFKVWNFIFSGSATQSEMQIRNSDIFTTSTMYQSSLMSQYKNKLQSALSYALQTTNPGIDSLNSSSLHLRTTYSINSKMRVGTQSSGMLFKSGGYKYEGGVSYQWQVTEKSVFKLEGNIGRINQIWGFESEIMRNSTLTWMYQF